MHKVTNVFGFTDTSDIWLGGNDKEEEPYENFDPPLHSTAIDANEEASLGLCAPSPQGKEAKRNSGTSEIEANENKPLKLSAKKKLQRKHKPVIDESESSEETNVRSKGTPVRGIQVQHESDAATASSSKLPEAPLGPATSGGPWSGRSAAEQEILARGIGLEIQKKMCHGKKKKSKNKDPDKANYVHAWCLEGQSSSDVTELGVILSVFEDVCLQYKQEIQSKYYKEAINTFYADMKTELIRMLKEVQRVKILKRKNTKVISNIEKKRQHLIKVQEDLLCLEPQLKQLQTRYDELEERKTALRNATCFISNLRQLQQNYKYVRQKRPDLKETYDSSSIPALLFKARTILGAEIQLQNINQQLETLTDQE